MDIFNARNPVRLHPLDTAAAHLRPGDTILHDGTSGTIEAVSSDGARVELADGTRLEFDPEQVVRRIVG